MDRRAYLATFGVVATAGCVGPMLSGNESPVQMGETAGIAGVTVSLSNPRLREAIFLGLGEFITLEVGEDQQFLLVDVGPRERRSELAELELRVTVDGKAFTPEYDPTTIDSETAIGVPVPVTTASSGSVDLLSGDERMSWTLPDRILESLDTVPRFAVLDATARTEGGDVVMELTVENSGNRDGSFRALAAPKSVDDFSSKIEFAVPMGDRVVGETVVRGNGEEASLDPDWSEDTRYFGYSVSG